MAKSDGSGWGEPGRRWNESDAREALKALSASGMSTAAFARQYGFSAQRLRSWRPRVSDSATAAAPSRLLVPLVVRQPTAVSPEVHGPAVVVRTGSAVMEIRDVANVDPVWLARVMAAAGASS